MKLGDRAEYRVAVYLASMHRDLVTAPSNTEGKGREKKEEREKGAEEMVKWVRC